MQGPSSRKNSIHEVTIMGATLNRSGDKAVITLDGDATLPQAEELRSALIKALIDSDDVAIVLENVREVDLSCLQLLCSAHRSAARLKKRVALSGDLPAVFRDTVAAAGFDRLKGCKLDTEKSCLWTACTGGAV